jgi:predicted RNA-binding protein YlxR (DUF448 family)
MALAAMDTLEAMDTAQSAPDDATAAEPASEPLRRCIVTRDVLPKDALIRFVIGPSGEVVPDVQGRLPGRGLWVKAERAALATAVAKNLFAKAARRAVETPPDLVDRTANLLRQRCLDHLGLARRAGQVVCGFEKVSDALRAARVAVLVAASDAAADGRSKLKAIAGDLPTLSSFTVAELSGALGRENVVHAALAPGRLAERLLVDAARLVGFEAGTAG